MPTMLRAQVISGVERGLAWSLRVAEVFQGDYAFGNRMASGQLAAIAHDARIVGLIGLIYLAGERVATLATERKQSLHDLLAGTVVVNAGD